MNFRMYMYRLLIYRNVYSPLCDDFKIFCRNRKDAVKIKIAVTDWLSHRLKLHVSEEKIRITNLKKYYSEFLGFKFEMQAKGNKQVINAQMSNKAVKSVKTKLKDYIKLIQKPENEAQLYKRVNIYNLMVVGIQNYYGIANNVCINLNSIQWKVSQTIENRLTTTQQGEIKNSYLAKRYGKSKQIKWVLKIPTMPIGYCKSKNPMCKKSSINQYTPEGREEMYNKPYGTLEEILHHIMRSPSGVLEHPSTIKNTDKLRESWNSLFKGSSNSDQIAVLKESVRPDRVLLKIE